MNAVQFAYASFLFTATACHHLSSTPPRTAHKSAAHLLESEKTKADPPTPEPKSNSESLHGHKRLQRNAFYIIASTKYILWAISTLEFLSFTFSLCYPSSDLARIVLPILLPARSGSPPLLDISTPYISIFFWLCILSIISGYLLRRECFAVMGRHFTFTHTTLKDHRLITAGPYSIVRHPSYTGEVLVRLGAVALLLRPGGYVSQSGALSTLGLPLTSGNLSLEQLIMLSTLRLALLIFIGWVIFALPYLVVRSPKEDATLRETFGEEWDQYAKRVPWRFIPYVI